MSKEETEGEAKNTRKLCTYFSTVHEDTNITQLPSAIAYPREKTEVVTDPSTFLPLSDEVQD